MCAKFNFDATKVAPQKPMEPVPTDWYPVIIIESEVKPTKDTLGQYLELTYEIVSGEFKGRKGWDRLNIKNKSAQAQEIGLGQLSAVCHAVGVLQVKDSKELHNKPFMARFVYKAANDQYDASNDIKGYKPMDGAAPGATTTAATAVPAFVKKAAPTAPTPPPAPQAAPPPPPVAPPAAVEDTREFFVFDGKDTHEMTGAEVRAALNDGLSPDSPICLASESANGWKTMADFELIETEPAAPTPPPPAPAATGSKTPPWKKSK
jgi:hypothetical protein